MLSYIIAALILVCIYALLAQGLNLVWGITGLNNLGLLGYYAVGAYATALISKGTGMPIWASVMLSAALAGLVGALTFSVLRRLSEEYLAIVTLGFAETLRVICENAIGITNGTDGISQIPRPFAAMDLGGFEVSYLILMLVILALVTLVMERLRRAPFGRMLRAIREDPAVAAAAGKNVFWAEFRAFTIGSVVMGLGGALYSHYISFVSPEIFQLQTLIYIFLAVVLGGKGNVFGVLIGAVVVVFILESTRMLGGLLPGMSAVQVSALRIGLIGVLFIVILQTRARGILPEPRAVHRSPDHTPGDTR